MLVSFHVKRLLHESNIGYTDYSHPSLMACTSSGAVGDRTPVQTVFPLQVKQHKIL